MTKHPLFEVADEVHRLEGEGMEIEERPLGRGAWLRVWLPSETRARAVALRAVSVGLSPQMPVKHPRGGAIDAIDYDGYQLMIGIPAELVRSAQQHLADAQQIATGHLELDAAPPELNP